MNTPSPNYTELLKLVPGITEGGMIIIGLIVFAILFLWYFGRAISRKVDGLLHQVANDHDTNLRDDLDGKDSAQHGRYDSLERTLNARFDRMNDRITSIDRRLTGIDTRLNSLKENSNDRT